MMVGISGSSPASARAREQAKAAREPAKAEAVKDGSSLLILYGSNAGTCKYIAEDLATVAKDQGIASTVKTMDQAVGGLPTDQPVVIITPSYEGRPADNAKHFVTKIETAAPGSEVLKGVRHAIFGVGNSEWATTFHRIPKLLNGLMPRLGSEAVVATGYVDVKEDLVGAWDEWRDGLLAALRGGQAGVAAAPGQAAPQLTVTVEKPQAAAQLAGEEISEGVVLNNEEIATAEVGPAKRHMEVELPEGMAYEPGGEYRCEWLVDNILTRSERLPRRFADEPAECGRPRGQKVQAQPGRRYLYQGNEQGLPGKHTFRKTSDRNHQTYSHPQASEHPILIADLLSSRVELSTPASKRQVETLLQTATDASEKAQLEALVSSDEAFKAQVLAKRASVLDLLEDFPSAELALPTYLDLLRPLAPRQYSISSSPLASGGSGTAVVASVTYDVHAAPARSGHGRLFEGVASSYLARRAAGSRIRCYVRRSNAGFHLPSDPGVPLILLGAGTGLAPFRGFIQERACIAAAGGGKTLGPALMYFGCRDAERDYIYKTELGEWEAQGAVQMRPAFSRMEGQRWKYVHERMWDEREEVAQLFRAGGRIYVCGSASKLAKSVLDCVMEIWMDRHPGATREEALVWVQETKDRVRYVSDVFD